MDPNLGLRFALEEANLDQWTIFIDDANKVRLRAEFSYTDDTTGNEMAGFQAVAMFKGVLIERA